jgi:hypothetical protein
MTIPAKKIMELAEQHKDTLKALSFQLATNSDVPALQLINRALAKMGIDRVTYERIIFFHYGWEHTPVSAHLPTRRAA